MRLRTGIILIALISLVGFLGYSIELTLPTRPPNAEATLTPTTQSAPSEVGSYDVLGKVISRAEAEILRQTEEGKVQLASEIGAVEVTDGLIQLGKDAFYRETFGNEYFFTDVVGAINGPINLTSMSKAILALKGEPTTNLQIKLDRDVTVGGKDFPAGTVLNVVATVPTLSEAG